MKPSSPSGYRLPLEALAVTALACFAGLVAGLISSAGRPEIIAILTGATVAMALASSTRLLLWLIVIGGLVVTGVAQLYWPNARYVRYIVPLASLVLLLHGILGSFGKSAKRSEVSDEGLSFWLIAFMVISLVSAAINFTSVDVAVAGARSYFQMWAFFFALTLIRWSPGIVRSLPRFALLVAFLQLPFVLHQYAVLVPLRASIAQEGMVPFDIIAGTFGGSLLGGGANAVLAAYMVIVIACVLGVWKNGALASWKAVAISAALIAPIFVNGAKVSAIYIPLVFVVVFSKDIAARPARFLIAGTVMFFALVALVLTMMAASSSETRRYDSWTEFVAQAVERQVAPPSERQHNYSELGRWSALTYWAEQQQWASAANIVLGYGPGASRVQEGGLDPVATLAETRYGGIQIGYTALSSLLWDVGLLGVVALAGAFFAAFRCAGRLANFYYDTDPVASGIFNGLRGGVCVLALSLAHKSFFVTNLPFQTLVLLIFGYLVVCLRRISETDDGVP